jgi:hypothetical protein
MQTHFADAHFRQRQASPRCASGTRSSSSALNVASRHQHGVATLLLEAAAQSLAPPQIGQVWA